MFSLTTLSFYASRAAILGSLILISLWAVALVAYQRRTSLAKGGKPTRRLPTAPTTTSSPRESLIAFSKKVSSLHRMNALPVNNGILPGFPPFRASTNLTSECNSSGRESLQTAGERAFSSLSSALSRRYIAVDMHGSRRAKLVDF